VLITASDGSQQIRRNDEIESGVEWTLDSDSDRQMSEMTGTVIN